MPPDPSADQARTAIQAALGQIGFTLPGSITIRRARCGKPRCACAADPPSLHGPYIQWTRTVHGKTVTQDVRRTLSKLAQTRSTRTMASTHNVLVRAIRHAEANDRVGRNVASLVKPPQGKTGRPSRAMTAAEAAALLAAAMPTGSGAGGPAREPD